MATGDTRERTLTGTRAAAQAGAGNPGRTEAGHPRGRGLGERAQTLPGHRQNTPKSTPKRNMTCEEGTCANS